MVPMTKLRLDFLFIFLGEKSKKGKDDDDDSKCPEFYIKVRFCSL